MEPLTLEERNQKAEQASMMAFLAVILCLMTNCGCFSVFLAVPISLWALHLSRIALDLDDPPAVTRAYAAPARNIALVTFLFSALISLLIIAYFALYGSMIALAVGISIIESL